MEGEMVKVGGDPSPEGVARPVGAPAHSSAVHALAPEIAGAFVTALRDADPAPAGLAARKALLTTGLDLVGAAL
ncbi:hypothetical protein ACFYZB_18770 [Streptomyces sp. NPDC001852]|uniref:hypothetical protein n=1 Tax=Streptomyces sp. NPDC001852 TaxID=3364619 RepID=UPI00369FA08D